MFGKVVIGNIPGNVLRITRDCRDIYLRILLVQRVLLFVVLCGILASMLTVLVKSKVTQSAL